MIVFTRGRFWINKMNLTFSFFQLSIEPITQNYIMRYDDGRIVFFFTSIKHLNRAMYAIVHFIVFLFSYDFCFRSEGQPIIQSYWKSVKTHANVVWTMEMKTNKRNIDISHMYYHNDGEYFYLCFVSWVLD